MFFFVLEKYKRRKTLPFLFFPDADPEYYIVKRFKEKLTGYTNRSVKLHVTMNEPGAQIKWLKDGKPISVKKNIITSAFTMYLAPRSQNFFHSFFHSGPTADTIARMTPTESTRW